MQSSDEILTRSVQSYLRIVTFRTIVVAAATIPSWASASSAGLVAAYGFDEGSGATAADASGNGLNGTINAATWSANGKFGNALSFNGASSWVTVPDAPPLKLTTGMTLSAWVLPS